jgi:hypothetical protein
MVMPRTNQSLLPLDVFAKLVNSLHAVGAMIAIMLPAKSMTLTELLPTRVVVHTCCCVKLPCG